MIKYFVVGDIGAHSGHIASANMDDIWRPGNENGWTYQQLTGPHGRILGEFDDEQDAEKRLEEWLRCDSIRDGTYCYTHNPNPRGRMAGR